MPVRLTHPRSKKFNSNHSPSQLSISQPILSGRGISVFSDSEDTAGGLRRSQRARRPSNHKLESDEYQASSRGSSRPASPQALSPNKRPKKNPFGAPGNRPGRLAHPDVNARSTSHSSSPKSSANSGRQPSNSLLATGAASNAQETITKTEAVRRATAFLGADASHLSTKTLQMVLAEIPGDEETDNPESMEVEGGSAPAILQPTERLVLESGHQLRTSRTADVLTTLQYSQTRSAHTNESHVSSQPRPEVAHDEDTATEPESEPEVIELGPGDSVSQQYPSSSRPIPTNLPNSPLPIATTWVYHYTDNDDPLNIDESDPSDSESDSERELDAVHINKRPRLTKDPIPHPLASQAGASGRCSDIAPLDKPVNPRSDYAGSPRSTHVPSPRSACVTTLSQSRTAPTALTSLPTSTSSLPQPRPSDAGDLLAWATQLADLITRSRVPTSQASTSHQARQTGDPNDQLAQAPSDLRTHLTTITTTPASTSPTNTQRPPKRPRHTDLVEDNTEILELEAALTLGTHVRARRKPNFSDFPGLRRRIASLAVPEFLVLVCTRGAYETLGTFHDWAEEAYNRVWQIEASDAPLQKAPYALSGIIVHRVSWLRGEIKARLRPLIPYLMSLTNPPKTADDLKRNRRRVKKLLPNRFHCLDVNSDADPFGSPAVPDCIAAGLFWGPDSLGAIYHNQFRPIPLPTIAMILTIMQHCIEEWKPGRFVPLDLKADRQLRMYDSHMKGLIECTKPAGKRLANFQEAWFWHGLDHAGVGAKDDEPYQKIIHANHIRPDTPV